MRKIFLLLMLFPVVAFAQDIIPLVKGDLPDAIVSKPQTYDPSTVWEYMGDGIDLMTEFGFTSLVVQDIQWENGQVKVEITRFENPEAAFGFFSLSFVKCLQRDSLTTFDCTGAVQYQAAYGNLYITVTGEQGSDAERRRYIPTAEMVLKKNQREILVLPGVFSQPEVRQGRQNLAFIRGPVGLQNCMFPLQELFLGVRFGMYVTLLTQPDNDIYFAQITFPTPNDQTNFLGHAGLIRNNIPVANLDTNDGLYREYQQKDPQTIYFLQSQEPYPIDAIINPAYHK